MVRDGKYNSSWRQFGGQGPQPWIANLDLRVLQVHAVASPTGVAYGDSHCLKKQLLNRNRLWVISKMKQEYMY